jgi:hypothetical protein
MEAICSSETLVASQQTTRRHIPGDDTFHNHRCENLKSYNINVIQYTAEMLYGDIKSLENVIKKLEDNDTVMAPNIMV